MDRDFFFSFSDWENYNRVHSNMEQTYRTNLWSEFKRCLECLESMDQILINLHKNTLINIRSVRSNLVEFWSELI